MRLKLNSSDISLNVLGSSLLIILVGMVILAVNYKLIEKDYVANNATNEGTFKQSQKKVRFLELKEEINQVALDVNWSTAKVLDELKGGEQKVAKAVRNKINSHWKEKIDPSIDRLDKTLKEFPDEIKSDYFKIADNISRIRKIQENLVDNIHDTSLITKNQRDGVAKVTQYTGELNTGAKEFLEDYLTNGKQIYVTPKYRKDYLDNFLISFVIFVIAVLSVIYRSSRFLKYPIHHLEAIVKQIFEGNLPQTIGLKNKDYLLIAKYIGGINDTLKKLQKFADHVGKGEFDSDPELKFIEKGKFGVALHNMQDSLMKIAREDSQRSHINQGLAKFSEILGNNSNNLERFGDDVILNLVQFLNANQGALFVVKEGEENEEFLDLSSCFAYEKKKFQNKKIIRGQGLVGQCWQEKKRLYMTDVPKDYINITSGLGYSTPRCILIVPLIFNDKTQGIIELASFKELENYELNFIEKVAQSISSALASVKVNTKTQVLLNQSEQLTRKMKIQEDKMRHNVEELRMTQEESQRREEEHLREISRLRKRLEEYERSF